MLKQIVQNSLILSCGLLLGRLSGFIRELLISRNFGTSADADLLILMLSIPDLLNNLIMAGAVSGVLIPLLAKYQDNLASLLYDFIKKLFVIATVLYVGITILFFYGYDWKTFCLLFIVMLSVFPNMITFVVTSVLQFEKRFTMQSLNTLIFNAVVIIAILLGSTDYYFAGAVIFASIIRMFWVGWDLKRGAILQKIRKQKIAKQQHNVPYRLLIMMMFANGLVFVLPVLDKITASFLYESAVSTLSYAEKLYLLPVSVFLTTFAVALFPDAAKLAQQGKQAEVDGILKKALPTNLLLSLLVVLGFVFLGEEVSYVVFGWLGNLTEAQTLQIAKILHAYLPVVLLSGSIAILLNMLFAFKVYGYIIFYSVSLLVVKLLLNTTIVFSKLEVVYVSYSTSLTSILAFTLLSAIYWLKIKGKRSIL